MFLVFTHIKSSLYTILHQFKTMIMPIDRLLTVTLYRSAEKLELTEGRWVFMQPMLSRRSTLGIAILNDCLYAVGGFDGNSGLDSVEKYSPGIILVVMIMWSV